MNNLKKIEILELQLKNQLEYKKYCNNINSLLNYESQDFEREFMLIEKIYREKSKLKTL
jgi:hypothetical protein